MKTLTQVVELAKRLHRASPKTGERRSLRKISAELAAAGYLNERGQPFNPNSIKLMLLLPVHSKNGPALRDTFETHF